MAHFWSYSCSVYFAPGKTEVEWSRWAEGVRKAERRVGLSSVRVSAMRLLLGKTCQRFGL